MARTKIIISILAGVIVSVVLLFGLNLINFDSGKSFDILPSKYEINTKCQFIYTLLESKYAGKEAFKGVDFSSGLDYDTMQEQKKLVEKWGGVGYSGSWDNLPQGFWNENYRLITKWKFEIMGVNPKLIDRVTDGTGAWLYERYTLSQEDVKEDPRCAENIKKYYSDVVRFQ